MIILTPPWLYHLRVGRKESRTAATWSVHPVTPHVDAIRYSTLLGRVNTVVGCETIRSAARRSWIDSESEISTPIKLGGHFPLNGKTGAKYSDEKTPSSFRLDIAAKGRIVGARAPTEPRPQSSLGDVELACAKSGGVNVRPARAWIWTNCAGRIKL